MAIITQPIDSAEAAAPSPALEVETWRRWLIMFILLTGGIKTTLAFTTVVPGLQLIAEHFRGTGDNVLGAQFVVTMAPIGMAVTGLFAGWIVNAGGLRRTLFISLATASFCGLSQLWIQSFPALLASLTLPTTGLMVVWLFNVVTGATFILTRDTHPGRSDLLASLVIPVDLAMVWAPNGVRTVLTAVYLPLTYGLLGLVLVRDAATLSRLTPTGTLTVQTVAR